MNLPFFKHSHINIIHIDQASDDQYLFPWGLHTESLMIPLYTGARQQTGTSPDLRAILGYGYAGIKQLVLDSLTYAFLYKL